MSVNVLIPASLRKFCEGLDTIEVQAADVREALSELDAKHPGIKAKLCDDNGKVRRFINIYANQEDIRFQEQLDTPLSAGQEIQIIPAIAGGR
jgi:molybdopterin converting factor small subunit